MLADRIWRFARSAEPLVIAMIALCLTASSGQAQDRLGGHFGVLSSRW